MVKLLSRKGKQLAALMVHLVLKHKVNIWIVCFQQLKLEVRTGCLLG